MPPGYARRGRCRTAAPAGRPRCSSPRRRGSDCQVHSTRPPPTPWRGRDSADRKSTRLNSSHGYISYAVFCLKKKIRELDAAHERVVEEMRKLDTEELHAN